METPKNLLGSNPKAQIAQHSVNSGETDTWKLVVSFIIGALVGALGVWVSADEKKAENIKLDNEAQEEQAKDVVVNTETNTQEKAAELPSSTTSGLVSTSDAVAEIAVDNQKAGDVVAIKQAKDSAVFWVAIHEDRDGMPGNVLGATRFESGMHLGEVSLLRSTVAGGTYYAMMHRDDGDKIFDIKKDVPVMGGDGKPVMVSFKAE